ncbi:hypothetical protein LTR95_017781, partial [Oleoguttula sp. CCFEE 5521]
MARRSSARCWLAAILLICTYFTRVEAIRQTFEFGSVNDLSHTLPLPSQPDGDLISGPQLEDLYGSDDMESPVHTFGHEKRAGNYGSGTPYWVSQIKRQGKAVYGVNA